MSKTKTAKVVTGGFQAHGDITRFIPLRNGEILFRNPVTGLNERSNLPDLVERLENEFSSHVLYNTMVHDLADIGSTRMLRHMGNVMERLTNEAA